LSGSGWPVRRGYVTEGGLSETKSLTEADWTADSWAAFASARETAQTLTSDKGAAQEQVDDAADALAAAVAALVKA
jgi:hypothetical protein